MMLLHCDWLSVLLRHVRLCYFVRLYSSSVVDLKVIRVAVEIYRLQLKGVHTVVPKQ